MRALQSVLLAVAFFSFSASCGKTEPVVRPTELELDPLDIVLSDLQFVGDQATFRCEAIDYTIRWATLIPAGGHDSHLQRPTDVSYDPDGWLHVLDREASDVFVLDATGNPSDSLSAHLGVDGLSTGTHGLASRRGGLAVWDHYRQRVIAVRTGAHWVTETATVLGNPLGGLPTPIEVLDDGRVVVSVGNAMATPPHEVLYLFRGSRLLDSLGPFPISTALTVVTDTVVATANLPDDLASRIRWSVTSGGDLYIAQPGEYTVSRTRHFTIAIGARVLDVVDDGYTSLILGLKYHPDGRAPNPIVIMVERSAL